jgi:hypothetical protein
MNMHFNFNNVIEVNNFSYFIFLFILQKFF